MEFSTMNILLILLLGDQNCLWSPGTKLTYYELKGQIFVHK